MWFSLQEITSDITHTDEIAMSCQKSEIGGAAQAVRRTAHKLSMNKSGPAPAYRPRG